MLNNSSIEIMEFLILSIFKVFIKIVEFDRVGSLDHKSDARITSALLPIIRIVNRLILDFRIEKTIIICLFHSAISTPLAIYDMGFVQNHKKLLFMVELDAWHRHCLFIGCHCSDLVGQHFRLLFVAGFYTIWQQLLGKSVISQFGHFNSN